MCCRPFPSEMIFKAISKDFEFAVENGELKINIATVNFKFLFYGSSLEMADDCKKSESYDRNSAQQ